MGDVLSLAEARAARRDRRRVLAAHAVMHPALRWVTDDDHDTAHRRFPDGWTACGLPGPLTLADDDTGRCPDCYPRTGT